MKINARAYLANANKGLEAAAAIIVADYLRDLVEIAESFGEDVSAEDLTDYADRLDPR